MTPSHLKSLKGVFAMARLHCFQKQLYAMQNDKKFLEKEGADFEEINIDEQPEKLITSKA